MPDQFIRIEGLDQLARRVDAIPDVVTRTLREPTVLRQVGTVLAASGEKTVTQGGRPAWKPLAASTIARKGSSKPMIDKGTLRNSLDYEVEGGALYLTSVEYLKYHQFEEGRTTAKFPARPVWGVQEEDLEDITDIILDKLSESL